MLSEVRFAGKIARVECRSSSCTVKGSLRASALQRSAVRSRADAEAIAACSDGTQQQLSSEVPNIIVR
jgi:hypothetical protein